MEVLIETQIPRFSHFCPITWCYAISVTFPPLAVTITRGPGDIYSEQFKQLVEEEIGNTRLWKCTIKNMERSHFCLPTITIPCLVKDFRLLELLMGTKPLKSCFGISLSETTHLLGNRGSGCCIDWKLNTIKPTSLCLLLFSSCSMIQNRLFIAESDSSFVSFG